MTDGTEYDVFCTTTQRRLTTFHPYMNDDMHGDAPMVALGDRGELQATLIRPFAEGGRRGHVGDWRQPVHVSTAAMTAIVDSLAGSKDKLDKLGVRDEWVYAWSEPRSGRMEWMAYADYENGAPPDRYSKSAARVEEVTCAAHPAMRWTSKNGVADELVQMLVSDRRIEAYTPIASYTSGAVVSVASEDYAYDASVTYGTVLPGGTELVVYGNAATSEAVYCNDERDDPGTLRDDAKRLCRSIAKRACRRSANCSPVFAVHTGTMEVHLYLEATRAIDADKDIVLVDYANLYWTSHDAADTIAKRRDVAAAVAASIVSYWQLFYDGDIPAAVRSPDVAIERLVYLVATDATLDDATFVVAMRRMPHLAFVDVKALEIHSDAAVASTKGRRFVEIEATHVTAKTIAHLSRGTDRFLQDVYGRDDAASCDMNCGASPSEIQQAFDAIRRNSIH